LVSRWSAEKGGGINQRNGRSIKVSVPHCASLSSVVLVVTRDVSEETTENEGLKCKHPNIARKGAMACSVEVCCGSMVCWEGPRERGVKLRCVRVSSSERVDQHFDGGSGSGSPDLQGRHDHPLSLHTRISTHHAESKTKNMRCVSLLIKFERNLDVHSMILRTSKFGAGVNIGDAPAIEATITEVSIDGKGETVTVNNVKLGMCVFVIHYFTMLESG